MTKNYSKYTSKELLEDDFFIQSMIHPTPDTDEFWNSLLEDGILDYDDFEEAQSFILLMQRPRKVMTAKERNDLWVNIEVMNKKKLRKALNKRKIYLWGTAASLLLVLSVFSILFFEKKDSGKLDFQEIMSGIQESESKDIQLILSDNKTIQLEETSADIELNKEGGVLVNSRQLAETVTPEKKEEISYNQLIVPMGRHSRLTLPDGTKMHINAGSKVIFPHKFSKKEREIFVDGEVYLEVAQNEKVPFNVRTASMDLKVLGTAFNVRAYQDDTEQSVVLVSGSVSVVTKDKHEAMLSPNQKLAYSNGQCSISAINANDYIAWINGYFIYNKEPLTNIMKQISRYYGVEVTCGPNVHSFTCSGKLDLKEELDIVMGDLAQILNLNIDENEDTYHIN